MGRTKTPEGEPTRVELEILQVLWSHGPSTVRFVNDHLNRQKNINYTSTLKMMQLMYEKRMLNRDTNQMTHIYRAAISEKATKKAMLNRFVKIVYNGSTSALMIHLHGGRKNSKEEITTLKELLKELDK